MLNGSSLKTKQREQKTVVRLLQKAKGNPCVSSVSSVSFVPPLLQVVKSRVLHRVVVNAMPLVVSSMVVASVSKKLRKLRQVLGVVVLSVRPPVLAVSSQPTRAMRVAPMRQVEFA